MTMYNFILHEELLNDVFNYVNDNKLNKNYGYYQNSENSIVAFFIYTTKKHYNNLKKLIDEYYINIGE